MDIKLRVVKPEYADELLKIYSYYVKNTAISFEYDVPTVEEFTERINNITINYPYIAATLNNKIVGYAYAGVFKNRKAYSWSVETTVYVDKDNKQNGIGRILYTALEKCLKKQGILNLNACIAVPCQNDEHLTDGSRVFHGKMGYNQVALFHDSGYKFNKWYDMIWMEKIIGEHKSNQPDFIPFSQIKNYKF